MKILTLFWASPPRHWGIPIVIIMLLPVTKLGSSHCAPSPNRGLVAQEAALFYQKKGILQKTPLKIVLIRSHHTRKEGTHEHWFSYVFKKGAGKRLSEN